MGGFGVHIKWTTYHKKEGRKQARKEGRREEGKEGKKMHHEKNTGSVRNAPSEALGVNQEWWQGCPCCKVAENLAEQCSSMGGNRN